MIGEDSSGSFDLGNNNTEVSHRGKTGKNNKKSNEDTLDHSMYSEGETPSNQFYQLYALYVRDMILAVVLGQLIFVILASSLAVSFFSSMLILAASAALTAALIFPLKYWAVPYLDKQPLPQELLDLGSIVIQITVNSCLIAGLSGPYFLAFFSIYGLGLLAIMAIESYLKQFPAQESIGQGFLSNFSVWPKQAPADNRTSLELNFPSLIR